eukprot:TRINITY_DN23138_c0_g1_i1.p1 TRINITY_DN23138_c0_g1~~TRINITY_DN23138_c0_g1_i1.p1  ORF type:complete len:418 (+),score=59.55 TRINITY_DN23138_c0_g1_i1:146-1399(+)
MGYDEARRQDEADSLAEIFGSDFHKISDSEWKFVYRHTPSGDSSMNAANDDVPESDVLAELICFLPSDYPESAPPALLLQWRGQSVAVERGAEQRCREWVESCFEPDVELGMTVAGAFYEYCEGVVGKEGGRAEEPERKSVEVSTLNGPSAAEGDACASPEDLGFTTASIPLDSALQRAQVQASLEATSGFARYSNSETNVGRDDPTGKDDILGEDDADALFVHGELGLAVEFRGGRELILSVDGLDTEEMKGWLKEYSSGSSSRGGWSDFGPTLLQWTEAQRTKGEATYGSADGIADDSTEIGGAKGITLTGNAAWKARLQAGETVQFRGGGNSLHPRIKSGECCKYTPVFSHEDVKEKDIVFCQIKGRYWGHMVKKKTFVGGTNEYEYTISNIHGWENGTIPLGNVYGKVIDHWK